MFVSKTRLMLNKQPKWTSKIGSQFNLPSESGFYKFFCVCPLRFVGSLDEITSGKREVTMILNDPAGNSYVQALTDDGSLDDRLIIERYDRSFDQNEELGLNDIKTENYS